MHLATPLSLFIVLAWTPLSAAAPWVQHCRSPAGAMSYTASNCPPGHELVAQQAPGRHTVTRAPVKVDDSRRVRPAKKRREGKVAVEAKVAAPKVEAAQKLEKLEKKKRPIKYLPNVPR